MIIQFLQSFLINTDKMKLIISKATGVLFLFTFAFGAIAQPDKKYDQHIE